MQSKMPSDAALSVAVIGAGASGLAAIKCCLDERLETVCFEKSDEIGGLWRYTAEAEPGRAGVYQSTTINTSKEMLAYSTFPPPAEFPNFMHHSKLYEYMRMYAEEYKLGDRVMFNAEVTSVEKSEDFSATGKWLVTWKDRQGKKSRKFNAVMVCTGHHAFPNNPAEDIPGRSKFKGRIFHGHDYRHPKPFENRRVMVVGVGNTGGDLAAELSRQASKVFLSTRRGSWVINRISDKGVPYDFESVTRAFSYLADILPPSVLARTYENKMNSRFDHELYGLKPDHSILSQHPLVNDELPARIANGTLSIVHDISRFCDHGIVTTDGSFYEVDDIIFATGYVMKFPFLPEGVVSVDTENNLKPLYKHVFPISLSERPTLALIGNVQPLGGLMPLAEMQSRWAARVFKGYVKLPSTDAMLEEVKTRTNKLKKRYVNSKRHTVQVDYLSYMDCVAEEIHVRPKLKKLFLSDPRLAWEVLTGPATSYQFRLHGTGAWNGAKAAIATQWHRMESGFYRKVSLARKSHNSRFQGHVKPKASTASILMKNTLRLDAFGIFFVLLVLTFATVILALPM